MGSKTPTGFCQCGCGRELAREDQRFIYGHARLKWNRVPEPSQIRFESRGYKSWCWIWQLPLDRYGYGRLRYRGGKIYAHRFFYEHFVGQISEGLTIDHLCCVTACVNPSHLEPVSQGENARRAYIHPNTRKTHCKHGHPFDEANTYLEGTKRKCRACGRAKHRRYRTAKRLSSENAA